MNPYLQAALYYASLGWYVFPLHSIVNGLCTCGNPGCSQGNRGKHPATPHGKNDASIDPDQINRWWANGARWNVGISTDPSNLAVMDVDPRNGGHVSYGELPPPPQTWTVQTGGGGLHLYFLNPTKEKISYKFRKGIEVITNGYVVAPPSVHHSGGQYRWIDCPKTLSLVDWLLSCNPTSNDATTDPSEVTKGVYANSLLQAACSDLRTAQEGGRKLTLNRKAFQIGQCVAQGWIAYEEAFNALLSSAPIREQGNASDFTTQEARETIAQAFKDAYSKPWKAPQETENTDLTDPGKDWTELGLARRTVALLEHHKKSSIISDMDRSWFFNGKHWQPLSPEDTGLCMRWHGLSVGEGKTKKKINITANYLRGVETMLQRETLQVGFFDNETNGIPFQNGCYRDGSLHPYSATDKFRHVLQHAYDPNAETRIFDGWFSRMWPDQTVQKVILEYFGAAVLGITHRHEKALLLTGNGANGKSTLTKLLIDLFQPETVMSVNPHDFGHEYYRARLYNCKLNIVTEMKASEMKDTEAIKAFISGERVDAREPAGRVFSYYPRHANIFLPNRLPMSEDSSYGWRRRFIVVPCEVTIAESEKDINFIDTLKLGYPGFIRRVVEGAERLVKQGKFTFSARIDEEQKEWTDTTDQIAAYIEEACQPSEDQVTNQQIYDHYAQWARRSGHVPVAKRSLLQRLKGLGVPAWRTKEARGHRIGLRNLQTVLR